MSNNKERLDIFFKDIVEVPELNDGNRFFIDMSNGRWIRLNERECELLTNAGNSNTDAAPASSYRRLECKLASAGLMGSPGIPRKTRLMEIQVSITSVCNLECIHCFLPHPHQKKQRPFMPPGLIDKIAQEAREMGVETISITGGEPFLHPDIRSIIERIVKKKFRYFSIATNGTKLSADMIGFLAENNIKLNLGCDSLDKSTYEQIRRNADFKEFLTALQLIEKQKKNSPGVELNFTINRLNREEIPAFFQWAADNGFKHIQFSNLIPSGRARENHVQLAVPPHRLKETWENIVNLAKIYKGAIKVREIELLKERIRYGSRTSCAAARKVAYIDVSGELFPCHFLSYGPALNLEQVSLPRAWEQAGNLNALRELHVSNIPGCRHCPFRALCGGGCRAGLPHLRAFPVHCPGQTIIKLLKEES